MPPVQPTLTHHPIFPEYGFAVDNAQIGLVCLHPDEDDLPIEDESPLWSEPCGIEPPTFDTVLPEQYEAAIVSYLDADPAPEEPEPLAIGPVLNETLYQYYLMEPYTCVW